MVDEASSNNIGDLNRTSWDQHDTYRYRSTLAWPASIHLLSMSLHYSTSTAKLINVHKPNPRPKNEANNKRLLIAQCTICHTWTHWMSLYCMSWYVQFVHVLRYFPSLMYTPSPSPSLAITITNTATMIHVVHVSISLIPSMFVDVWVSTMLWPTNKKPVISETNNVGMR